MNIIVCKDQKEVVTRAHQWLMHQMGEGSLVRVFVPAGDTPRPLYAYWREHRPTCLEHCHFIQIDEVITGPGKGQFAAFLKEHLSPWAGKIEFIDTASGGAEVGVLGLGLNGHVAFHEPELPVSMEAACVRLSPETCKRLGLSQDTWGVTYGVGAFIKCRTLLLMVLGESKREILARLLDQDPDLPASFLLKHKDLTILVDKKAYGDHP